MNDNEDLIICYNCGFEYPIDYTELYLKDNISERICYDCIESDNDW
jgi:hypothetical protein